MCLMQASISAGASVAKILPDKEVRKLLGTVILNADEKRINPNGIEFVSARLYFFIPQMKKKKLAPICF